MGNANISEELKEQILKKLEENQNKTRFQNLKGFIDNACSKLLAEFDKKESAKNEIIESIRKQSGLNFSNLLNSVYLVKEKEKIPEDLPINEQIDLHLKNLGLKEVKRGFNKDTYYGLLTDFAWHMQSDQNGAEFTPINHQITELIKIFPKDVDKLVTFRRRLIYLKYLEDEIKYIVKRYDFNKIPIMFDWLNNKFEEYATLIAELSLIITEYHLLKSNRLNRRLHFEEVVKNIFDIDDWFKSINVTIQMFIITTIRHAITHSTGYKINIKDQNFVIDLPEIDFSSNPSPKIDFGIMKDYLKDVFNLFNTQPKKHGNDIILTDPRFPYVTFRYTISKSGSVNWNATKLILNLDLNSYLSMSSGNIFLLTRTIFGKLLANNKPN